MEMETNTAESAGIEEAIRLYDEASGLADRDEYSEAEARALASLRIFEAHGGPHQADVVNILCGLAGFAAAESRHSGAAAYAARAVEILSAIRPELPPELDRQLSLEANSWLGNCLRELGCYPEAETHLLAALAASETAPAEPGDIVQSCNSLGVLYKYMGKFDEAERQYRRALRLTEAGEGLESHTAATLYHNLGGLAHSRGDFAAGLEPARRAYDIRRKLSGDGDPRTAADAAALGGVLDGLGRFAESRPLYQSALEIFTRLHGPVHFEIAANLHNLANVEHEEGNPAEAERLYRRALEIKETLLGPGHPDTALTRHNLGVLLAECGRPHEARPLLRQALDAFTETLGADHPHTQACARQLA